MSQTKKLYRSESDKIIAGVCGGVAEYFGVDSIVVRLVFLILVFWNGIGLLAYLVMAIIVPSQAKVEQTPEKTVRDNVVDYRVRVGEAAQKVKQGFVERRNTLRSWLGWGLLSLGSLILLDNYHLLDFGFWSWVWRLWPAILVATGLAILVRHHD